MRDRMFKNIQTGQSTNVVRKSVSGCWGQVSANRGDGIPFPPLTLD